MKKYSLYAIGEIFLVMVGILLALQVNNWNEVRKMKNIEQNYLASLKEEFLYNQAMLERVMYHNSNVRDRALELTKYTGPDTPEISEKEFESILIGTVMTEVQYRPSTGVLNEVINSGKLGNFSNPSLRNALSSWDGILYKVRFQEDEVSKVRYAIWDQLDAEINGRKAIVDIHSNYFGLTPSKFEFDNRVILQSQSFENKIVNLLGTSGFLNSNYYPNLEKHISLILKLIDQDLNVPFKPLYDDISIIGSAVVSESGQSLPMEFMDQEKETWEITTSLKKGTLRFRNRDSWDFNWGGNDFPTGQLVKFGKRISVEEGEYKITFSLKDGTYHFEKK